MDSNNVIVLSESADILKTILTQGVGALLTSTFVLLAAYIAYKSGLKAYFTKREHEQIIKRYLDEGIDRVLAGVDQVLRVFLDNYMKAVVILDQVRRNEEINISVEFQRFERQYLELAPYQKIAYLVGDQVFWLLIQKLLGFVDGNSAFLNTKLLNLVKNGDGKITEGDTLEGIQEYLNSTFKKYQKYSLLVNELQQIASSLEKQTMLNWANLAQFKDLPEIRASLKKLSEIFETELQKS